MVELRVTPAGISPSGATPAPTAGTRPTTHSTRRCAGAFSSLWQQAAAGELSSWETSDDGALALVIVLDQFPRNMFRGDVGPMPAMRWRARWRAAPSIAASTRGSIRHLREFLYLPFMHSEHLADQLRCIELFAQGRPYRKPEMGRAPRRHHPAVRPLPSPQSHPGPRDHAGGAGLSRRGGLFALMTEA